MSEYIKKVVKDPENQRIELELDNTDLGVEVIANGKWIMTFYDSGNIGINNLLIRDARNVTIMLRLLHEELLRSY